MDEKPQKKIPKLSFWNKFTNITLAISLLYIGASMISTQEAVRGSIELKGPTALATGIASMVGGLILITYTVRRIARERSKC
jgi:hypothetical protein